MYDINLIKETFENQMKTKARSVHQYENIPNNSVYRVETETNPYIFKIFSSNWPEDGKIPFVCQMLTEHAVPHAKLHTFNREDENFPNGYLIEELIPGVTADRLELSEEESISLYEKLADLVSRFHKIEMVNYGYMGGGKPAAWTTFSECLYDILQDNSKALIENGFIKANEFKRLSASLREKMERCDIFPPVLCHGDLSAKNIIVNSNESNKITLIDWDDAHSMIWMYDIARLTFWMKIQYNEPLAAAYRLAFLNRYETIYDKNVYYEMEDILHVWFGLDNLTFFTKGETCEKVKKLLRESRNKCGITGYDMYVETERLILRDFEESDAQALYEIKYDEQVLEYAPDFIKRDADLDDTVKYIKGMENIDPLEKDYAICLKETGEVIGAITTGRLEYLYEPQIGWMMNGKFAGKGYASEAGAAASDYLLETLPLDYLAVVMDTDNPASFRTAQKSGFKLFEKRYPNDYHYGTHDHENFDEVTAYFKEMQTRGYSDGYYYFRKFNRKSKTEPRFYGDTKYDGRFS